jgi:hypothetical protein
MENSAPTSAPSVIWHIVWQVVEGRDLLADPALIARIRARFLAAHRQPGRELVHYLLTPTEMHLLSRLPACTAPSEVARAIGNIVARWVRQAQRAPGVVFAGRYRAYAIESDAAARNELRMLAWRPVILGLCRVPTHHSSSSLRSTLALQRVDGFKVWGPLRLFQGELPEARAAFSASVSSRPSAIEIRQWELSRGMVLAPGDAGTFSNVTRPVQGLAAALVAAGQPQGIDGALLLLERWVMVKLALRDGDGLAMPHSLAGARVRALVACLAVQLDLCSAASVARHYGRAKATLSERMAACRREPEDRAILGLPLGRIVEEAIGLRHPEPPSDSGGAAVHEPL